MQIRQRRLHRRVVTRSTPTGLAGIHTRPNLNAAPAAAAFASFSGNRGFIAIFAIARRFADATVIGAFARVPELSVGVMGSALDQAVFDGGQSRDP